jgi:hypothetical protein
LGAECPWPLFPGGVCRRERFPAAGARIKGRGELRNVRRTNLGARDAKAGARAAVIDIIIKMEKDAPYLRWKLKGFESGSEASREGKTGL